jgi:hypothetical protein
MHVALILCIGLTVEFSNYLFLLVKDLEHSGNRSRVSQSEPPSETKAEFYT